jgi:hypothetical protein
MALDSVAARFAECSIAVEESGAGGLWREVFSRRQPAFRKGRTASGETSVEHGGVDLRPAGAHPVGELLAFVVRDRLAGRLVERCLLRVATVLRFGAARGVGPCIADRRKGRLQRCLVDPVFGVARIRGACAR